MRFDPVDLSALPPPAVVEQLDFESYLTSFKADFVARAHEAGWEYDVELLESDPVVKVLEVAAYRELLLRGRVNDGARAVMLATSMGADLENLGALYKTGRQVVTEATVDAPAVLEPIERYRARVQIAPEAFSTCGPEGAYLYHAMQAAPAVRDVAVLTPQQGNGEVHVLPLVADGNGTPSQQVLEAVRLACNDRKTRPLTDILIVRAPRIVDYGLAITVRVGYGPDPAVVRESAVAAVAAYAASRHRVGVPVYRAGVIAAAKVGGVENVTTDFADLVVAADEAPFCTSIVVTVVSG